MSKPKSASAQTVSPFLKCRAGDLAMILEGPNTGLIVDVVQYRSVMPMSNGELVFDAWRIRHPSDEPNVVYFKEDKYLLPIRPSDLQETETDERLSEGAKQ